MSTVAFVVAKSFCKIDLIKYFFVYYPAFDQEY